MTLIVSDAVQPAVVVPVTVNKVVVLIVAVGFGMDALFRFAAGVHVYRSAPVAIRVAIACAQSTSLDFCACTFGFGKTVSTTGNCCDVLQRGSVIFTVKELLPLTVTTGFA